MCQKSVTRPRRHAFQPTNHFLPISVSRKASNLIQAATHRDSLAKNPDFLLPVEYPATESSRCLIANKYKRGIRIGNQASRRSVIPTATETTTDDPAGQFRRGLAVILSGVSSPFWPARVS